MKNLHKIGMLAAFACALVLVGPAAASAAGPAPINLGTAGNFTILAKTGVSVTGSTVIVGDIGISPAAASYITGFGLTLPAGSPFSTSALVSGKIYAPDYANPTPANLTNAVLDMQNAYTDGAGRAPSVTELGAGNIGGLTLAPGVYKWGTGVTIPTDVTLSGSANDVWIFVIAQNLTVSSGAQVVLSGGAQANNVFWVVAGQTTIGTTAIFNGNILGQTAIVLNTGATLNGRSLAQSAVTLDSNSVNTPYSVVVTSPVSNPVYTQTVITSVPTSISSNQNNNVSSGYSYTSYSVQPSNMTSYKGGEYMPARDHMGNLISASTMNSQSVPSTFSNFGQQVRMIAIDLRQGSRNDDVAILQQFLISQNKGSYARVLSNVGPTAYFGSMTRAALAEFQASVGISPAIGNFGPVTRGYLNANY